MVEGTGSIDGQAPRRRARTPKYDKAQEVRNSDLANAGRILPNCPTTAVDLVEQWQIPSNDVYEVRVNVLKQSPGDASPQLMASVPALEFDMHKIASEFGPGLYFLKGSPSRWSRHSARFEVSEQFARNAGFGRVPPKATEAMAVRTLQEATTGPSDPVALLAALEALMDKKLRDMGHVSAAPAVVVNPVKAMEEQANSFMSFMGVVEAMEGRMMAIAERRAGLRPETEAIPEGGSIMGIVQALAPYVGPVLQNILTARNPEPPRVVNAAKPKEETMVSLPELNEQEKQAIGPAVAMLKPYAKLLAEAASDRSKPDAQLADDLMAYIPPAMYSAVASLAEVVKGRGVAVLGYIGPELAQEPRWSAVLDGMNKMIREAMQE